MERGANTYRVIVKTARPGLLIGRNGEGVTTLKADIDRLMKKKLLSRPKELKVDVEEVRAPDTHAGVVAHLVAEALEKRLPFKRVMKQTLDKVRAHKGVEGARITLSGRLGGAEMSRTETLKRGRLPLQTLRADIDFARERAHLSYGDIGIKVWIYKGEVFGREA